MVVMTHLRYARANARVHWIRLQHCAWRKDNPIELGWERLLETPETEKISVAQIKQISQVENPYCELSTQQIADFLANFNAESDCYFPSLDSNFEQILSQYDDSTCPSVCQPTSVFAIPTANCNDDFPTASQTSNISSTST